MRHTVRVLTIVIGLVMAFSLTGCNFLDWDRVGEGKDKLKKVNSSAAAVCLKRGDREKSIYINSLLEYQQTYAEMTNLGRKQSLTPSYVLQASGSTCSLTRQVVAGITLNPVAAPGK